MSRSVNGSSPHGASTLPRLGSAFPLAKSIPDARSAITMLINLSFGDCQIWLSLVDLGISIPEATKGIIKSPM